MNKFEFFKKVVGFTVSAGVGAVVTNAIKATTPVDIGRINKILVRTGNYAITGLVSSLAADRVMKQLDELAESIVVVSDTTVNIYNSLDVPEDVNPEDDK